MKVLIVDDNKANRKLLNSYFYSQGDIVIEAEDGSKAVDLYKQHLPDIVLMDIMMPDMDGYEAVKKIKSEISSVYVPVIYVTALQPETAMTTAVESGGDDFISKPINFEILSSKINAHMRIKEINLKLIDANDALSKHNKRMQRENELVEHIFNNALSKSCFDEQFIRYKISPVSAFNGDLLLAEKRQDGSVCVLLGDFTGHGLSAAVGSLPVVKVFFTMVQKGLPLQQIVREINSTIKMLLPANIFLCASLLELSYKDNSIQYWSGGLPPMLINNAKEGLCRSIKGKNMPLGVSSNDSFSDDVSTITLNKNERLYLYTDGITEVRNEKGEMFGSERLVNIFSEKTDDPFEKCIEEQISFQGVVPQDDDMTLIELRLE